jgi:hypothetical protein
VGLVQFSCFASRRDYFFHVLRVSFFLLRKLTLVEDLYLLLSVRLESSGREPFLVGRPH